MRESIGSGSNEDDLDENDQDKKKSKKTKVAKRIPLALSSEEVTETAEVKPRLSIAERLIKQLEIRTLKEEKNSEKIDQGSLHKDLDNDNNKVDTNKLSNVDSAESGSGILTTEFGTKNEELITGVTQEDDKASTTKRDWSLRLGSLGDIFSGEDKKINEEEFVIDKPKTEVVGTEPINEVLVAEESAIDTDITSEASESTGDDSRIESEDKHIAYRRSDETMHDSATRTPDSFISPTSYVGESESARRRHKAELNDVEYAAEKRGQSRGITTGLFVGWLIGRRGKRRAERAHEQEIKSKNDEISKVKSEQALAEERLRAVKSTQEQLKANIESVSRQKTYESLETNSKIDKRSEKNISSEPKVSFSKSETSYIEKDYGGELYDRPKVVDKKIPESKKPIEERLITAEDYQVEEGKRVETSAWHRIEVDQKTGKIVDDPEVSYGEEFRREQKQEIFRDEPDNTRAASVGGFIGGLFSATSQNEQSDDFGSRSKTGNLKGKIEDPGVSSQEHNHVNVGSELLKHASEPFVWIAAVVVVIALFIFGILS